MVSIRNTTNGKLPRLPFRQLKNEILGKSYELSLVCVNPLRSRELNRVYRHKDKPTNILAFPLSSAEGEIILDLKTARRDAPRFGRPYKNFLAFLVIHALFHLKGFSHGSTMEQKERTVRKKFGI